MINNLKCPYGSFDEDFMLDFCEDSPKNYN